MAIKILYLRFSISSIINVFTISYLSSLDIVEFLIHKWQLFRYPNNCIY